MLPASMMPSVPVACSINVAHASRAGAKPSCFASLNPMRLKEGGGICPTLHVLMVR